MLGAHQLEQGCYAVEECTLAEEGCVGGGWGRAQCQQGLRAVGHRCLILLPY